MAREARVQVQMAGVEPVKAFIAKACAAHAAMLRLTPGEYDALPQAAQLAASELRGAVSGLIGEGIITAEQVEDLVSEPDDA
jgi:hypothetical protein